MSVLEGVADAQEDIVAANRFSIDDEYTQQDAVLRLGESAFAGFFGGAGVSGAGSTAVGSLRGAGNVMAKAKNFIEEARQQQVDNEVDIDQMGGPMGFSNPNHKARSTDNYARLSMKKSARHSVWIEGGEPSYDASPDTTQKVDIQGQTFYTRFIPGRGTIISKNFDVAEEVAKSQASETALAEALGYSDVKPADGDIAIEVLDRGGNVIWQQGTNEAGVPAAMAAAEKQIPEEAVLLDVSQSKRLLRTASESTKKSRAHRFVTSTRLALQSLVSQRNATLADRNATNLETPIRPSIPQKKRVKSLPKSLLT